MSTTDPRHAAADAQGEYQVRFDWAVPGLNAIASGADAIVIVGVLTLTTDVERALTAGAVVQLDGLDAGSAAEAVFDALGARVTGAAGGPLVLLAGLRNRRAVARFIREQQARSSGRYTVAIAAAGQRRPDGSLRVTVEDQLAAGALVDALAELGIDYHSPEAAVVCAGFLSLTRAVGQLTRASASGRALLGQGRAADVAEAGRLDVSEVVPMLGAAGFRDACSAAAELAPVTPAPVTPAPVTPAPTTPAPTIKEDR